MPKTPYFAFKQEYPARTKWLINDVVVIAESATGVQQTITARALWDTGATDSAVTPHIVQTLGLIPINRRKVTGANDTSMVDVVELSVVLPNKVKVENIDAFVCNLNPNIDMLIGMDIIMLGDFAISNGQNTSLFSFVTPPLPDKTDLYKKALAVNKNA